MALDERGAVINRARISYFYNYGMIVLVSVLFIISWSSLDLTFSFAPQTLDALWKSMVVLGFVGLLAFLIEEPTIDRHFRYYMITNSDVISVAGIIRKSKLTIPHQSISNVTFYKSIMGRIFNFGDVDVVGFGKKITMKSVPQPEVVYRMINNKISMMRGSKHAVVVEEKKTKPRKKKAEKDWKDKKREMEEDSDNPIVRIFRRNKEGDEESKEL